MYIFQNEMYSMTYVIIQAVAVFVFILAGYVHRQRCDVPSFASELTSTALLVLNFGWHIYLAYTFLENPDEISYESSGVGLAVSTGIIAIVSALLALAMIVYAFVNLRLHNKQRASDE